MQNDGGFGGSALIWIFALLILACGGFGGFGNNGNSARQEDIQRAVDLNSIQEGQASIAADVQRTAYETMGTVKDSAYNNLSEIRDVQAQMNSGFANLQNCCCDMKLESANNKFELANAIHAEGEATRNLIQTNKIDELQQQINALQMQNAMVEQPSNSGGLYLKYIEYLKSEKWHKIATKRMKIDKYECQCCGCKGTPKNPLEVHHLSYRYLYNEETRVYEDLVTLCHVCHKGLHNIMNRKS